MKNKKLFTDIETTGLDPVMNGIHQIAGIIVVDDKEVERFNFKVKPFEQDLVETEALKVSDVTYDEITTYEEPEIIHEKLLKIIGKYCNKFNKKDKFHFIAYNSPFDNSHWRQWFKKCDDKYFGSFFFTPDICVMRQTALYLQNERHKLMNFKLATVAEYLRIIKDEDDTQWHDAMADIDITKKIYYKIIEYE